MQIRNNCQKQSRVLFVKAASPLLVICVSGVVQKQRQVTDPPPTPPALHFHKSIPRAPSRSITLTGLQAGGTTQGDHHKTTCHRAISHLAVPLKQAGKQRQEHRHPGPTYVIKTNKQTRPALLEPGSDGQIKCVIYALRFLKQLPAQLLQSN